MKIIESKSILLYAYVCEKLTKTKAIKVFNEEFFLFIEKMTVYDGQKIIVTLLDGVEIEVIVE